MINTLELAAQKLAEKEVHYCSFCGKSSYEVKRILRERDLGICEECVSLCNEILAEDGGPKGIRNLTTGGFWLNRWRWVRTRAKTLMTTYHVTAFALLIVIVLQLAILMTHG